jgi:hypothetical protein
VTIQIGKRRRASFTTNRCATSAASWGSAVYLWWLPGLRFREETTPEFTVALTFAFHAEYSFMRQSFLLFVFGALALAGCNKGPSLKTYPVTGTVTYNGKPVAGATVNYISKDQATPPTTGVTDTDGRFSLSSYIGPKEVLRGAVSGDYQVTILKEVSNAPGDSGQSQNMENLSDQERQQMMTKMWQQRSVGDPKGQRPPDPPKPKSEIPLRYAKPESSGLVATVVAGENEPREFKLSDD